MSKEKLLILESTIDTLIGELFTDDIDVPEHLLTNLSTAWTAVSDSLIEQEKEK